MKNKKLWTIGLSFLLIFSQLEIVAAKEQDGVNPATDEDAFLQTENVCIDGKLANSEEIYVTEITGPEGVELLSGFAVDTHVADHLVNADGDTVYAGGYEDKYNAYELGLMPDSVRLQIGGTCWAHAAIGAMEADLILNDQVDPTIDLSEKQLAYFTAHNYDDPKDCSDGDVISFHGKTNIAFDYLNNGGHSRMAGNALTSLVGAVPESSELYTDADSIIVDDNYALGGRTVQLKNFYEIPADDKDGIKWAIKNYGSVVATYYAISNSGKSGDYSVTYSSGDKSSGYIGYNKENNAYYGEMLATNHAVMLIGWDDNFSTENFNEECRPTNNGAWLVRNSWGQQGYGFSGYFWISYEDYSLTRKFDGSGQKKTVPSSMFVFDASLELDDNVYSYYRSPGLYYTYSNSYIGIGQSVSVNAGEEIKAVGFYTLNTNLWATVTIKAGAEEISKTIQTTYGGFYYAEFDEGLVVSEDCEVQVQIEFQRENLDEPLKLLIEQQGSVKVANSKEGTYIEYNCTKGSKDAYVIFEGGYKSSIENDPGIKLYTNNAEIENVRAVEVDKAGLALDGRTCLQFAIRADEFKHIDLEGAYAVVGFWDENNRQQLSDRLKNVDGEQYYIFDYSVAAKDMGKKVILRLYENDDTPIEISNSNMADGLGFACSVYDYLSVLSGEDDSTNNLVESLASYGFMSECFFDKVDPLFYSDVMSDIIGEEACERMIGRCDELTANELGCYSSIIVGGTAGINYVGSSLLLEAGTTIRHYFMLDEGYDLNDYKITVGNRIVTPVVRDRLLYVDIENISAADYDVFYRLSVNDNDFFLLYSVNSYIYEVMLRFSQDGAGNQNILLALMQFMYLYGQDASAYKG